MERVKPQERPAWPPCRVSSIRDPTEAPSNLLCCSLSGLFPEPPSETCCGTQAADHFLCVFSNVFSLGYYVLPFSRYVAMDVAGGFTISIYHQLPVAA